MKEVIVVGSGPAGMGAAFEAAQKGARVKLLDENNRPGGQVWKFGPGTKPPKAVQTWLKRLEQAGVKRCSGCTVTDIQDNTLWVSHEDKVGTKMPFDRLILATGARELFLPFPGWTLPNVTGVGGISALLKAGCCFRDKRVVVSGSGPLLFAVAGELAKAGAKVVSIAEQAPMASLVQFGLGTSVLSPGKLLEGAHYACHWLPASYRVGTWVTEARGNDQLREVVLNNGKIVPCDVLACGYGLVPNTELAELAGCRVDQGAVWVDDYQRTSVEGILCAGEMSGIGGVDLSVSEGRIAGLVAVEAVDAIDRLTRRRQWQQRFASLIDRCFALRPELRQLPKNDTIVCRCEDITYGELKNHPDPRSAKLMTRSGMGACQGRVCSAAMQFLFGWEANRVRPPLFPVRVGDMIDSENQ